jgi:hypothetical protein
MSLETIVIYRALSVIAPLFVVMSLTVPAPAAAQGNGRPKAPKDRSGKPDVSTATPAPVATSAPPAATSTPASAAAPVEAASTIDTSSLVPSAAALTPVLSFRQFGSWLDDASAPIRGEGSTSISIGHWRMAEASQTNVPMLGASFGVSDRMQVSASVPFYRVSYQGTTSSGMDDVYVGTKYTLVDPTLTVSEFGLAIAPVMEVLSAGADGRRVHFAIPVTLELRRAPFRVYGSAGYFTRGSMFTGGAIEWGSRRGFVLTGALTQSYSLKEDTLLDSLAVSRQRVDATASGAYPLGTMAAAFVSVGRSLSSLDEGGTSLALSGGISVRFAAPRAIP